MQSELSAKFGEAYLLFRVLAQSKARLQRARKRVAPLTVLPQRWQSFTQH